MPRWLQPLLGVVVVLVALELVVQLELVSSESVPLMTDVFDAFVSEVQRAAYWEAIWSTLQGWAFGLAIAIVLAVPIGLAIGLNDLAFRATRPIVEFLRPVPSIALLPVAILIYGISLSSKVFLAAIGAFWQLLVLTIYGAHDLDPLHRETARSYRISQLRRFFFVSLPGAVPYIATGLRIASTVALLLSVTAELLIGSPGIGVEMNKAREAAEVPLMYAYVVTAGLLGWGLNVIFIALERVALRWHPSQREERG